VLPVSRAAHRLVQVRWYGPFTVEDVCATDGGWATKQGLYQVYGQHVVFGPEALLYIGMTDGQTFGSRFKQHERWLKFESDTRVRLGVIADPDERKLLAHAEALTIWWHSPPYNSKNIWRYPGIRLHVRNSGQRGRLVTEYQSHWGEDGEAATVKPPKGER
jgi:hypothetical protein